MPPSSYSRLLCTTSDKAAKPYLTPRLRASTTMESSDGKTPSKRPHHGEKTTPNQKALITQRGQPRSTRGEPDVEAQRRAASDKGAPDHPLIA
jgi:hypothetical protein